MIDDTRPRAKHAGAGRWPWQRRRTAAASVEWLICGLGNPGPRYEDTRHNVGRVVLMRVADTCGASLDRLKHHARYGLGNLAGHRVCLAVPTTYMNEAGLAVGPLARFFKVAPEAVLLVHDDLDLPPGRLRVRPGGGAGGHNGVASVIRSLGTEAVPRLRVGIGRPPATWDPADYVLARFADDERETVAVGVATAAEAVVAIVHDGVTAAMNAYN